MRFLNRLLLLAILTSAVAGCGGGGSSGGAAPLPPGTYRVANFGGAKVATAVIGYQPASTTADDLSVRVECQNGLVGRTASPTAPQAQALDLAVSRDMPPAVRDQQAAARQRAEARMRTRRPGLESIQPRYSDLAEGDTTTFYIATTGRTVTVRKMHANQDTTSTLVFAEVIQGTAVIDKSTALSVDQAFGTANPFDPTGMGIGPRVRATFGSEWRANGGRDGETKVVFVVLSSASIYGDGYYGFFNPSDSMSKSDLSTSNEGEILYLNARYLTGDMFDALATVAHEFQHMCDYNQKYIRDGAFPRQEEADTINEGQSLLAEELAGFSLEARGGGNWFMFIGARAYLQAPHNYAFFTFENASGDYGKGYLFMKYLHDRFGVETVTEIATSPQVGRSNVAGRVGRDFGSLFREWALANQLDPVTGAPASYTYPDLDLEAAYSIRDLGTVTLPSAAPVRTFAPPNSSAVLDLKPWSNAYARFGGGDGSTLEVHLDGDGSERTNLVVESPAKGTFSSVQ